MIADFTFKAGDTRVVATDTLTYSDNTPVNLQGATVQFVMRSQTSATPQPLTGTTTITAPLAGGVQYAPSVADTVPGQYMASWVVTFADSSTMTFPTEGYLWVSIEENLSTVGGQQLVSLPALKDYMDVPHQDRRHDAKLVRAIHAVRPMIEAITGPIILQTFDEKYEGGSTVISLSHRPSSGYGTLPVLNLLAVSEYRGPVEYPLLNVASPVQGSIYSFEVDTRLGTITRRTSGGGTSPFYPGENSVHVVYQAGQATVPANVYEATLELIRINYETTMSVGRGGQTVTDEADLGTRPLGFFMPRSVREMIQPTRRAPSIA